MLLTLKISNVVSIKNLHNKPISKVEFIINKNEDIKEISKLISKDGNTEVKIILNTEDNKKLIFKLDKKRYFDRKALNILKNDGIRTIIH